MQRGALYLAIGLAVTNLAGTVDAQEYPNRPVHEKLQVRKAGAGRTKFSLTPSESDR